MLPGSVAVDHPDAIRRLRMSRKRSSCLQVGADKKPDSEFAVITDRYTS